MVKPLKSSPLDAVEVKKAQNSFRKTHQSHRRSMELSKIQGYK